MPRLPRHLENLPPSLLLMLALAACSGGSDNGVMASTAPEADQAVADAVMSGAPAMKAAPSLAVRGVREEVSLQGGAAASASTDFGTAPIQGSDSGPMLIRTANASVLVVNVDSAISGLHALAARVGGQVTSSTVQSGEYEVRSATLEIKVPAPRFDEALSGIRPLGKVEFVNVAAQDVGEEFTDVTARVTNARRLEDRLVQLLSTRTARLEEVLAVERELARVREQIERFEGRLRYLSTRVAMSTLSVTVHEKAPLAGTTPGQNPIVEALGAAWRNFVSFVSGFIAFLGILVPLALMGWISWLLVRVVRRRARGRGAEHGTATTMTGNIDNR